MRAILFDLDGTLLDSHTGAEAALAAVCALIRNLCPALSEEEVRSMYHSVSREGSQLISAGKISFATGGELHHHLWREVLARCQEDVAHASLLAGCYRAARRDNYRLYAEVSEALATLLDGYNAALLTNGPSDMQREKITAVGLERWIPRAYISGELGVSKPHAGIFRHALEELGCRAEEAVMVGDSLPNDIAGAADLGIRTVWVNRHGVVPPAQIRPDATIGDLRELAAVLAGWE